MKITLVAIQQETGRIGVRNHIGLDNTDKSLCGVRYELRERWFRYDNLKMNPDNDLQAR